MSRGKNCPGTIFASQLPRNYPHRRGNFERGKNALSCGGETVWEALWEAIWARVIASQKLSRDSGETIFAPRHQDVSQGPLGTESDSVLKTGREGPLRHSGKWAVFVHPAMLKRLSLRGL